MKIINNILIFYLIMIKTLVGKDNYLFLYNDSSNEITNHCQLKSTLNPYHYNNLKEFNPVMKEIKNTIESNNFPYLNMFVTEGKQFEPGILHDIMHTNDYGWMKINKFLYDTYKE